METVELNPASSETAVLLPLPPAAQDASRPNLLRRWLPILLKFASVQVLVQVFGFAAGILVVRNLSKPQYALYTLGNTMLAMILALADSGISSALSAIGGRVWQNSDQFSLLMSTAMRLRRLLAGVTAVFVVPVLVWLLLRNGADWRTTAALTVTVVIGCGFELYTRIYAVALRLKSEIRQIQNQAMVAAAVKFGIVAIAVMLYFNVQLALIAVIAGFVAQYLMLHHWAAKNLQKRDYSDPAMRSEILSVVRKQAPHTVFYCLQGQITIWLIGVFGNAERVADVGALSRLAVVFTILGTLTSEILFPAFARIQSPLIAQRRYLQIVCSFVVLCGLLVIVVALFPGQVLSVLGKQYSQLHREGVLMAASSVLGAIAGLTWGLNSARAWIIPPQKFIPVMIAIQVVLVATLNLSTVTGVLIFSILSMIPSILWAMGFSMWQIARWRKGSLMTLKAEGAL